jgi:hypothetical protein
VPSMSAVPTMTDQVHANKCHDNQHPEPIFQEPRHVHILFLFDSPLTLKFAVLGVSGRCGPVKEGPPEPDTLFSAHTNREFALEAAEAPESQVNVNQHAQDRREEAPDRHQRHRMNKIRGDEERQGEHAEQSDKTVT